MPMRALPRGGLVTNLNRTPIELWLLTHPDLRCTARVRAFMQMLARGLRRERDLLEGRAGAAAQTGR
jgi:hypothetical protein